MRSDMSFCPKCGTVVAGSEAEKRKNDEAKMYARESSFMWIKFLLIIYTIPVIILGIIHIANADGNANALWGNAEFQKIIAGKGITFEIVKNAFMASGVMALVSGILAGASLSCVAIRRHWLVAFVCCIASAILSVWSIIGLFIGLFVAWLIFDARDGFTERMERNRQAQPPGSN